jgi:hypothetical protein
MLDIEYSLKKVSLRTSGFTRHFIYKPIQPRTHNTTLANVAFILYHPVIASGVERHRV